MGGETRLLAQELYRQEIHEEISNPIRDPIHAPIERDCSIFSSYTISETFNYHLTLISKRITLTHDLWTDLVFSLFWIAVWFLFELSIKSCCGCGKVDLRVFLIFCVIHPGITFILHLLTPDLKPSAKKWWKLRPINRGVWTVQCV